MGAALGGRGENTTNSALEKLYSSLQEWGLRFPIIQTADRPARAGIPQQVSPQPTQKPRLLYPQPDRSDNAVFHSLSLPLITHFLFRSHYEPSD